MNRAQVSLVFSDENVYKNFVIPMKEAKNLAPYIVKCLNACYYNDKIRSLVDGVSEEDAESEIGFISEQQSIINDIQASLTIMDFGVSELESTISDGMSDISEMMNNDPTQTDVYQKFDKENAKEEETEEVVSTPVKVNKPATVDDDTISMLIQAVSGLYEHFGLQNNPLLKYNATTSEQEEKEPEKSENLEISDFTENTIDTFDTYNDFDSDSMIQDLSVPDITPNLESDDTELADFLDAVDTTSKEDTNFLDAVDEISNGLEKEEPITEENSFGDLIQFYNSI